MGSAIRSWRSSCSTRGLPTTPRRWQYLYDKAFVYYWTYRDAKTAAHWFGEAGKVPGSAEWLPGTGGLHAGAGRRPPQLALPVPADPADGRARVHEEDRGVAPGAARRARSHRSAESVLDRYAQATGSRADRPGTRWSRGGWLRGVPVDPDGLPLVIDRLSADGPRSISRSTFFPLPDEPPRPSAPCRPARRPRQRARGPAHERSAFVAVVGALGLFVGSFLNVCIVRLPLGRTVLWGRSHCPHCERQLRAWENLPLVSWLALGGRCAGCRAPIPMQYPASNWSPARSSPPARGCMDPTLLLVARLIFACAMVVLFMIDLQHRILPT